jgi:hypothetical protein
VVKNQVTRDTCSRLNRKDEEMVVIRISKNDAVEFLKGIEGLKRTILKALQDN